MLVLSHSFIKMLDEIWLLTMMKKIKFMCLPLYPERSRKGEENIGK